MGGRYSLVEPLGRGGSGSVFRARDARGEADVALKLFDRALELRHVLREFRVLARLDHPGCVPIRDYGHDAAVGPYLVMDLVRGSAARKALAQVDDETLLRFAGRLLDTLGYLHTRGVHHGDLKPDNIICAGGDPLRPVLIDFGLAARATDAVGGGTLAYMAPELLHGAPPSPRADLFALGATLFELATGVAVNEGAAPLSTLRERVEGGLPSLRERRPGVHPGLARLVDWLLEPAPGDRPASARDAQQLVAEQLGESLVAPEQPDDPSAALGAPALVERDGVVHRVDAWLRDGAEAAVLELAGVPGAGRTRLIEELELRGLVADALVVRCSGRASGDLAVAIADATSRALARGGAVASSAALDPALRQALERARETLVLGPALGEERRQRADRRADRVTELIRRASDRGALLLLIDDLEAAGPGGIDLIERLLASLGGVRAIVVVGVDRPGRVGAPDTREIAFERTTLQGLTPQGVARVVATALGRVDRPADLARWIADETGGVPGDVLHTLRWLVATGRLRRNRGRWTVADRALTNEPIGDGPTARARLARRRLEPLTAPQRAWLRAAAVMGPSFSAEAIDTLGEPAPLDDAAFGRLLRARLVIEDAGLWPLRFGSEEVRRLLLDDLRPDEARAIRKALIPILARLAAEGGQSALWRTRVEGHIARLELADSGAARSRARGAAVAEALFDAGALPDAEALLEALIAASAGWPDEQARYLSVLGDVAFQRERYDDAIARWEAALDLGLEAPRRWTVTLRLGSALSTRGRFDDGVGVLARLSDDPQVPRAVRIDALVEIGWARTLQGRYGEALSAADEARALTAADPAPRAEARVHKLRGTTLWHAGRWAESLEDSHKALRLFEELGDEGAAAEVQMAMGTAERHLANYDAALAHYAAALARFERLGMTRNVGKCQNNMAIVHYYRGAFGEALDGFEAALQVCERTGERVERVCLLNNLGSLYRERGMLARSIALLREGAALADKIATDRFRAMMLGNLGDALGRAGDTAEARAVLEQTAALARALGAEDELIEAERRLHELVAREDPAALDEAALDSLFKRAGAADLRLERGNVARLLAAMHRARGDLEAASLSLQAGTEALEGTEAWLELGRLELERARLLEARGERAEAAAVARAVVRRFEALDARWDVEQARAFWDALKGRAASLGDRHLEALKRLSQQIGSVVEPARHLSSALETIAELVPVRAAAIVAWRGDGSEWVRVDRPARADGLAPAPDPSLIEQMRATRRPVFARPPDGTGARAVVPLACGGKLRGYIFLEADAASADAVDQALGLVETFGAVLGASLSHLALVERDRERVDGIVHVAHELRTPLTALLGYLQIASMHADRLDTSMRDVVRTAASEAERLSRMVDNLNNLARLEYHNSNHTIAALAVGDVARDVVRILEHLSRRKQQRVNIEVAPALPPVLANRDHLVQILTNLLSNAIRFTPAGGAIRVVVERGEARSVQGEAPRPRVRVRVIDSGPGIPPDKLDTIFDKFAQAGAGADRRGGLGVGLAIAKGLVERYDGRLSAANNPSGGATFSVVFPVYSGAQAAP